MQIALIISLQI